MNNKMNEYEIFLKQTQKAFLEIGICKGDLIYISSDLTQMLCIASKLLSNKIKKDIDIILRDFIDIIKTLVGPNGTILIPTFSWDFCRKGKYDINNSESEVGLFGNWVLKNANSFIRTKHPIYSFAVWGKYSKELADMDNHDGWGEDSPFAFMRQHKAKNILFNVSMDRSFTFLHYVEKCLGVPYRYIKDFEGIYLDENGIESVRTYSMYVRDLNINSQQVTDESKLKWGKAIQEVRYEGLCIKAILLDESFEYIKDNLIHGQASDWYRFDDYNYVFGEEPTHNYEIKKMTYRKK